MMLFHKGIAFSQCSLLGFLFESFSYEEGILAGNCWFVSYVHIGYGYHGFPSKGYAFVSTLILLLENRVVGVADVWGLKISRAMTRNTEERQTNW